MAATLEKAKDRHFASRATLAFPNPAEVTLIDLDLTFKLDPFLAKPLRDDAAQAMIVFVHAAKVYTNQKRGC